jgi:hypothetical protein
MDKYEKVMATHFKMPQFFKWKVSCVYLCVRDIDFASSYDLDF